MNSRLNIQDLAGLLSDTTGRDMKDTELFMKSLISVISEGVYNDKLVKVKSLGTFKIVSVDKRESINVNTGERILIPRHYKFSFLPDKELREQVNKPFSIFETTELNDNVDFSDIDSGGSTEDSEDDIEYDVEAQDDNAVVVEESVPEESVTVVDNQAIGEPSVQIEEQQPVEEVEVVDKKNARKRSIPFIIFLVLSHLIMAVAFLFYKNQDNDVEKSVAHDVVAVVDSTSIVEHQADVDTIGQQIDTITLSDNAMVEQKAQSSLPSKLVPLGKIKIKPGDRLTVIALQYYGNKLFWVYIYQHNKSLIDDPNNVPIGTVVEIPSPELYDIDAKSPKSRKRAAELQTEILTAQ